MWEMYNSPTMGFNEIWEFIQSGDIIKNRTTQQWAYQLSITFPRFRTLDIGNLVNESLSQDVTTKVGGFGGP
jgi:hypothetical protein